jgi:hypothetical protein
MTGTNQALSPAIKSIQSIAILWEFL